MTRASIVATVDRLADLKELGPETAAARIEVRADRAGDVDPDWLRAHTGAEIVYTLRSRGEGGEAESDAARRKRLRAAAARYDFVTLEPQDLVPAMLAAVPESKRIIAARLSEADDCAARLAQLSATPASLYVFTVNAKRSGDELAPLRLLRAARRPDVAAYATGLTGMWTRIVAPRLGAPFVFGAVHENGEGAPSVQRLVESFGFPSMPPARELFGIAGDPVMKSLSPRIHNTAFRTLGRPALYVPFHVEDLGDFWRNVIETDAAAELGMPLRALSIVSPHKSLAVQAVEERSPIVRRSGSTNFVLQRGTAWAAETTDADGVLLTLRDRGVQCRGKRVAVVGCGGSGRAMAAALHQAGADVTLVNRGFDRGSLAVRLLELPFAPLAGFSPEPFSIVVNATPVGRDGDQLPFAVERLRRDATVVDLVYRDQPTPLIERTRGPGRVTIDGWDMLVTQASKQFELMTGMEMPEGLARQTVGMAAAAVAAR